MGKIIFRKEKYENHMINTHGESEYLLMKLNSTENDAWPDYLDGKDITGKFSVIENESSVVLSVTWKESFLQGGISYRNCFIKESWCDLID